MLFLCFYQHRLIYVTCLKCLLSAHVHVSEFWMHWSMDASVVRCSKLCLTFIMRPSSLGGGRILRRTLSVRPSVRLSVRLSVRPVTNVTSRHLANWHTCTFYFTVEPSYERTSKIEKLLFSLMGQHHVCNFRHAQRAAYRTAISAAQTYLVGLYCVFVIVIWNSVCYLVKSCSHFRRVPISWRNKHPWGYQTWL